MGDRRFTSWRYDRGVGSTTKQAYEASAYEALRIEAGMPLYGLDIDENALAPEVGRTAQAICYTKGCYIGQEPIVRIRDIGQVNRTLTKLRIEATNAVPHGTKLWRDGKEVGQVTSSALIPGSGEGVALAYVRRGNTEPGTVLEVEMDGERGTARVIPKEGNTSPRRQSS